MEGDLKLATEPHGLFDWFLIHYGWRGTTNWESGIVTVKKFLIHYGWRGTVEKVANELVTV